MKRLTIVLCLLALTASLAAAGEPITIGERLTIASKVLGEERTLLISTPDNYSRGSGHYPVLYMTDGDAHLTHTRGTVDFLVRTGLMPDLIIVGVTNTDRTRDLTPTHAFRTRDDGTREEIANSGGADRFLDFFEKELIPYVEGHYRTTNYRLFAGHSYGGLLALHTLLSRPLLFNAYIAASPSLNFDDDLPLRQAEAFFKETRELNRILFVTMADEERDTEPPTRFDRLQAILTASKAKGFSWSAMHMPDETHGSVVLRSHYWGLRKIFQAWQLPRDPETRAFAGSVDELKQHFAGLSAQLGADIPPPEQTVNQVGYQRLGRDSVDDAIAFFRYNVQLYPDSANVHDSLGEALERAGKKDEALASYSRAVDNAKKSGDDRLSIFTANRDRLAAAITEPKPE